MNEYREGSAPVGRAVSNSGGPHWCAGNKRRKEYPRGSYRARHSNAVLAHGEHRSAVRCIPWLLIGLRLMHWLHIPAVF
jgi:hypothetical protein